MTDTAQEPLTPTTRGDQEDKKYGGVEVRMWGRSLVHWSQVRIYLTVNKASDPTEAKNNNMRAHPTDLESPRTTTKSALPLLSFYFIFYWIFFKCKSGKTRYCMNTFIPKACPLKILYIQYHLLLLKYEGCYQGHTILTSL